MAEINLPPNIENFAKIVEDLQGRERLNSEQKKKLATCKLKIALWACRTEGMPLTRYSISEILGPDTAFVFINAQTAMIEVAWESEEDRAAMRALNASSTPNALLHRDQPSGKGKKGGKGCLVFIIAIVTCYHGLAQPLRIEEVSFATVRAVAQSVIACVLIDALFIVIYLAI